MSSIRVFAPATVANVVCGYDVLGFAVKDPGDEVVMKLTDTGRMKITEITGDDGRLPYDPALNTVTVSVSHYLKAIQREDVGVELTLHKKMPIGSGLGSSSASTVAGLFAVNELMGAPLSPEQLLPFAMKGEEIACGTGHADNVAPALYGGFVLVRSYDPLDVIKLPFPEELYCAIVFPEVDVPTRDARRLIKQKIPLKDAVTQWGNVAGLVAGLYREDLDLIGRCMSDIIVEPTRSILIPEFYRLKDIALTNGALGFGISGSGPSVFAFARGEDTARRITELLQSCLSSIAIRSKSYVSPINGEGPQILDL